MIGLEAITFYGLTLDFFKFQLRYQDSDIIVPISIVNKHAYIHSKAYHTDHSNRTRNQEFVLYSKNELRRLHYHFYHPAPTQLYNLIKRAQPSHATQEARRLLEDISAECAQCQDFHTGPLRFRVSIPPENISFNFDVAMDLVWLDHSPVLHIVDMMTRFQNACFLKSKSAESIWNAFVNIWVSTYTGFPATLHIDQESSFRSQSFIENCEIQGITLAISGVDSHNSIGSGESYHRQLLRVFNCVKSEYPNLERDQILRLSLKAVNDTAGINGIAPSALVFGVNPAFPVAPKSCPSQKARFKAMQLARDEMCQIIAERRINDALRRKLPPSTHYIIKPGQSVRVYREASKAWDGPFSVTKVEGKLITVTDGQKVKTFNVCQVLPNQTEPNDPHTQRELQRIFDNAIFMTEVIEKSDPRYKSEACREAIVSEIQGLERRNVFKPVHATQIPAGSNVLGCRFLVVIKNKGTTTERYKARLVVLGHRDREKDYLIHAAVPVRMRSVRTTFCVCLWENWNMWLEDTNQAYTQSTPLSLNVYIKADPNFGYPDETYLLLLLPLYGLSDAGDAWNDRLTSFLKTEIGAKATTTDKSLYFVSHSAQHPYSGLVAIFVDDCVYTGDQSFYEVSKRVAARFDAKPRQTPPFQFAVIHMERPTPMCI